LLHGVTSGLNGDFLNTQFEYEIVFHGPYRFLSGGYSVFSHEDSENQGIYLWTVPMDGYYLPYYVGETGISFRYRLQEHIKGYLSGVYRVYDPSEFIKGRKNLVWGGMWLPGTKDNMPQFLDQYLDMVQKIYDLIGSIRIFLAPIQVETRIRKRIEGAIASCIFKYQEKNMKTPFMEKEDRNRLCRKNKSEVQIKIKICGSERFIGLDSIHYN
jgi:hypothetical protein